MSDHEEAVGLILAATPEIPLWPQLPIHKEESMILQFLPGFPGIRNVDGKVFIDVAEEGFESELLSFYEDFLAVSEGRAGLDESRFVLTEDTAKGFFAFLEHCRRPDISPFALKGQITGPITFCMAIADQNGRAIFYNDQLKDAAVKLLALKAAWQVRKMAEISSTPILFFDEPGLAGLGSSAFITVGSDEIISCFSEVFSAVRAEGGLTGIHVCANTEWSVIFDADVDIVSCDTYSYFDKFLLYPDHLRRFFSKGGILASGIVPTIPEFLDQETADSLVAKWLAQKKNLEGLGIEEDRIFDQTLITPSCGTGSIGIDHARKVLDLTQQVSRKIRELR